MLPTLTRQGQQFYRSTKTIHAVQVEEVEGKMLSSAINTKGRREMEKYVDPSMLVTVGI